MTHEFQPGDVALVEDERGTQRIAVRGDLNPRMMHRWHYDEQGMGRIHADAHPLVVIDPEDREQIVRLLRGYGGWVNAPDGDGIEDHPRYVANMQAALREFANPTPVKPDEPSGLGAVVEDADGKRWVRASGRAACCWRGPHAGQWREYADIAAVRVLSEGVTA